MSFELEFVGSPTSTVSFELKFVDYPTSTAEFAAAYTGATGADPSLFFQVSNRFYEIAEDEVAKQAARTNLGLATIDGGTFN